MQEKAKQVRDIARHLLFDLIYNLFVLNYNLLRATSYLLKRANSISHFLMSLATLRIDLLSF